MAVPSLIIAGVEFALQSFPASQSYPPLEGSTLHRMLNGAGKKQRHWRKLTTIISGNGWAPAALDGVDWAQPFEISCIQPRALHSETNSVVLPTGRRSDFTDAVLARAVVNGELVPTPVSVVVNTATATTVAGATSYQFMYFPKLNFYSKGPTPSLGVETGVHAWTLEAEEV